MTSRRPSTSSADQPANRPTGQPPVSAAGRARSQRQLGHVYTRRCHERAARGIGGRPARWCAGGGLGIFPRKDPTTVMDQMVVEATDQGKVLDVGGAEVAEPELEVVGLAPTRRRVAVGEHAT